MERYEQLRSHALHGEPSGFRLGLAVLQRRGLVAWARAWQGATPGLEPPRPVAWVPEPPSSSTELVGALANMALSRVVAG